MPTPAATAVGGKLQIASNGTINVYVRQQGTTANPNVVHGLAIHVTRGPVYLRVGTSAGDDSLFAATLLRTGYHKLAFTPTSTTYWVEFSASANGIREVASISIDAAGDLVLPTPWQGTKLQSNRYAPSVDVTYVADGLGPIRRIERHANDSWSLTDVETTDGPYLIPNVNQTFTLAPSVRAGTGTIAASKPLFKAGHVGAIFKLVHYSQYVAQIITGNDQWTDPVKCTGVGTDRTIYYTLAGGGSATIKLQRSVGNTYSWQDVNTLGGSGSYNDTFDNQIIYYRIGVDGTGYISGTPTVYLSFQGGSTVGTCRITAVTSNVLADMEVLVPFGNTIPTHDWTEGAWSSVWYWPRAIAIYDGRLYAGAKDQVWGSVASNFESENVDTPADTAFTRALATGADMNIISWFLPLSVLQIGSAGATITGRGSNLDEAVTNTNFTAKNNATFGVTNVEPAIIDEAGIYIDRSTWHPYQLAPNDYFTRYFSKSLVRLHKRIGNPGITQIAVQRQPDTRAYFVRADGQCLVLLYDTQDNAIGWSRIKTDGIIESVEVLPGTGEDIVYFIVARQIEGVTRRYLEQLSGWYDAATEDCNPVDCYVRQDSDVATNIIDDLDHLEGRTVTVWGDGACLGDLVVASGQVTLPRACKKRVAGIYFEGLYTSTSLAYGAQAGTAHAQMKRPLNVAFQLLNAVPGAIEYGQSFTQMDRLGDRDLAQDFDSGPNLMTGVTEPKTMPGGHSRDPRLYIRATSKGGPGTIAGLVFGLATNERVG